MRFKDDFSFLSNFHLSTVTIWGIEFPTVEHAYQAAKTSSYEEFQLMAEVPWPYMAKKLGRVCTIRPDWNNIRERVMWDCINEKFHQHPTLAERLLATGDRKIVEGNFHHDNYWGACPPENPTGINKLGNQLMELRSDLEFGIEYQRITELDSSLVPVNSSKIYLELNDIPPSDKFMSVYKELMS